jgi:hypothetical protein
LISRHQASGYRPQGSGDETGIALARARSNGETPPPDPVVSAATVANGRETLKPETCSLKPSAKAET